MKHVFGTLAVLLALFGVASVVGVARQLHLNRVECRASAARQRVRNANAANASAKFKED